jgi:hypothetical protein
MNYPALIISTLALLFTVLGFWWMNWRRGRLQVGGPRSYAACSAGDRLILTLPFVFFNDGASAIVVQNLRLLVLHDQSDPKPLFFSATYEEIRPKDEGRELPTQFPIRGREAILVICEFQRKPSNLVFEAGRYPLELQAILNEDKEWKPLCAFDLNVREESLASINSVYIAYDNYDS